MGFTRTFVLTRSSQWHITWSDVSSSSFQNLQIAFSARFRLCICLFSLHLVFLSLFCMPLVNSGLTFSRNSFASLCPRYLWYLSLNLLCIHLLMDFLVCYLVVPTEEPAATNAFDETCLAKSSPVSYPFTPLCLWTLANVNFLSEFTCPKPA